MNPEILAALDNVLESSARWKHQTTRLHCFYPMRGAFADGRLMLVGRALYGWSTKSFMAPEMESKETRSEIITNTFEASSGEKGCPILRFYQGCVDARLKDRKNYNVKSSSFWNIGQQVVMEISKPEELGKWPSYLYWTNLYKLSLAAVGNPPWSLQKVILEASVKMLAAEIEALQPTRILFLTGPWWASHFLENNPDFTSQKKESFPNARVYQTGFWKMKCLREAAVVVADHPERKKRSAIFADVLEAYRRLQVAQENPSA
jgi:hypothetical protein